METVTVLIIPFILMGLFLVTVGGALAIGIVWFALTNRQKIARSLPLVFGVLAVLLVALVLLGYMRTRAVHTPVHTLVERRQFEFQEQVQQERALLRLADEQRQRQLVAPNLPPQPASEDIVPPTSAMASANAIPATDDRSTIEASPTAPPPDWVRAGVQRQGDVTVFVCSSRQYATVEEADAEARAAVREYLQSEQQRATPEAPFRLREQATVDNLVNSAIRDRYVESVQRDFGSLFATMYRVWLRAEISPDIQQRLRDAQMASLQDGRLIVAGSVAGGLLCIPLGIITCGQLNRWSHRRYSRFWQAAVSAGVLGAWIAGFVMLQRLVTLF